MLEQSTFNNDEIKKIVDENYGIEITNIKRINQGTANIFKIENGNNKFVYTSDIFDVDNKLKKFCKGADVVLIDSGIPEKSEKISLKGYHGETKYILDLFLSDECNIKKIYASHLKARVSDKQYFNIFPKDRDITLIKMGKSYNIL